MCFEDLVKTFTSSCKNAKKRRKAAKLKQESAGNGAQRNQGYARNDTGSRARSNGNVSSSNASGTCSQGDGTDIGTATLRYRSLKPKVDLPRQPHLRQTGGRRSNSGRKASPYVVLHRPPHALMNYLNLNEGSPVISGYMMEDEVLNVKKFAKAGTGKQLLHQELSKLTLSDGSQGPSALSTKC